ncbi:hypothetical protein L207DRAFT_632118 [Hyaloscypha variabilis F]|uniref:RTA1 domain protein n=1 Tax=Hyaloscypha variabilis (strain UAMH 11265 / GT02V1 / F) TaxID=1149755 RepID=A0A2J6RUZ2_HYAVF|nr:hypothetical protein L207DRAFT_632118 [Hyaloscypha variabilis F]
MENGQYVNGSLWFYAPNKVAPVVWALLFLVSGVTHAWQCMHYKCWKVTGILPWSALIFVVGYTFREYGAFHFGNIDVFIVSLVFIYAAPPLYELSNYLILSRILYYVPYHSPIHPGRVLTTFGILSTIIEALNANGAAYVANSSLSTSQQSTGKALLKAALCLQLGVLACFVLLATTFHLRCKKAHLFPENLHSALLTLYISSFLIGTRTLYRTVEYFTTSSIDFSSPTLKASDISPIMRYEWFFWVFEASLMAANSLLLNCRHPMRYLPRDCKVYLGEDGRTEVLGRGYEDSRAWWVTVLDPFDLWGMVRGRSEVRERFWETNDGERVVVTAGEVDGSRDQVGVAEKGWRGGLSGLMRSK